MKEATVIDPPETAGTASTKPTGTIVLDFGARGKGKIKRLRKGQGPLMARVNETIAEFIRDQTISASSPVVIVVVKQRRKSRGIFG